METNLFIRSKQMHFTLWCAHDKYLLKPNFHSLLFVCFIVLSEKLRQYKCCGYFNGKCAILNDGVLPHHVLVIYLQHCTPKCAYHTFTTLLLNGRCSLPMLVFCQTHNPYDFSDVTLMAAPCNKPQCLHQTRLVARTPMHLLVAGELTYVYFPTPG